MRSLHKSWQNKRSGWTHRVRWYQDEWSVRLQTTTPEFQLNKFFRGEGHVALAQAAYDAFRTEHAT